MRIVFFGASEIGWDCCRMVLEGGHEVVGLFSIPSEFRISWSKTPITNVRYRDFSDLSKTYHVPLTWVTTRMSDPTVLEAVRQLKPDVILVIGWYYMVPKSIRSLARLGAIGIHASLLPRYRGGAPLVWAMIQGETETGVSLFYLEDGVDEGDVIAQKAFGIGSEEDIAGVIEKAKRASMAVLKENLTLLSEGRAERRPQNHSQATLMPQRKPEDGRIAWTTLSAQNAYNWIRAQSRPYPGAFTHYGNEKLIIWKSRLGPVAPQAGKAGDILYPLKPNTSSWGVLCSDHRPLEILEVGLLSGQSVSAEDFMKSRLESATTARGVA